jgi:hypothetical protein
MPDLSRRSFAKTDQVRHDEIGLFNYFITGRRKICNEYEKNFAYRYCYDPNNGQELPIIAWCPGELPLLKGRCGDGL